MKYVLVAAALSLISVISKADEGMHESIIYIRNGQAVTLWEKDQSALDVSKNPAPCMKEIVVDVQHGQQTRFQNPNFAKCVEAQRIVNGQDRGGI